MYIDKMLHKNLNIASFLNNTFFVCHKQNKFEYFDVQPYSQEQ